MNCPWWSFSIPAQGQHEAWFKNWVTAFQTPSPLKMPCLPNIWWRLWPSSPAKAVDSGEGSGICVAWRKACCQKGWFHYIVYMGVYIYIYIFMWYIYIYMLPALPRPYFSHFLCLLCVSGLLIQLMHGPHREKKKSSISEHLLYWLSGVCGDGPNNSGGVIGTLMPMCGAIPMGGVGGGGPGGVPGAGRLGLRDRLRSGCTRSCGSVGGALHKDLFGDKTAFTHEKGCGT